MEKKISKFNVKENVYDNECNDDNYPSVICLFETLLEALK